MLGDYQKYEVNTKFTFEAEVFPEDPDDVYELAQLESKSVAEQLSIAFPELDIQELSVEPVIGE
jgi:hypothetical protein